MIAIRRVEDRRHVRRRKHEVWMTFFTQDGTDPFARGFGALATIDEKRMLPGASIRFRSRDDTELVSYLLEGALAYEDSTGRSGVMHAGEFQHIRSGPRIHHSQTNASRTEWARVFHIWLLQSEAELTSSCAQKRFCAADRRGVLCVIASPDGRGGSLRIGQDALIHSAMLEPGQHLVHGLAAGRTAWLHVVSGRVQVGEVVLASGDGAGITAERAVSLTACDETELLLIDLSGVLSPREEALWPRVNREPAKS